MSTYPSTSPEFRLEVQPASAPVPPILEVSPNADDSPPLRHVRTAGSGREKTTSRHLHTSGSILLGALVGGAVWGLVLHQCYLYYAIRDPYFLPVDFSQPGIDRTNRAHQYHSGIYTRELGPYKRAFRGQYAKARLRSHGRVLRHLGSEGSRLLHGTDSRNVQSELPSQVVEGGQGSLRNLFSGSNDTSVNATFVDLARTRQTPLWPSAADANWKLILWYLLPVFVVASLVLALGGDLTDALLVAASVSNTVSDVVYVLQSEFATESLQLAVLCITAISLVAMASGSAMHDSIIEAPWCCLWYPATLHIACMGTAYSSETSCRHEVGGQLATTATGELAIDTWLIRYLTVPAAACFALWESVCTRPSCCYTKESDCYACLQRPPNHQTWTQILLIWLPSTAGSLYTGMTFCKGFGPLYWFYCCADSNPNTCCGWFWKGVFAVCAGAVLGPFTVFVVGALAPLCIVAIAYLVLVLIGLFGRFVLLIASLCLLSACGALVPSNALHMAALYSGNETAIAGTKRPCFVWPMRQDEPMDSFPKFLLVIIAQPIAQILGLLVAVVAALIWVIYVCFLMVVGGILAGLSIIPIRPVHEWWLFMWNAGYEPPVAIAAGGTDSPDSAEGNEEAPPQNVQDRVEATSVHEMEEKENEGSDSVPVISEQAVRGMKLTEVFLNTLPMLILQGINNSQMDEWDAVATVSFVHTCYQAACFVYLVIYFACYTGYFYGKSIPEALQMIQVRKAFGMGEYQSRRAATEPNTGSGGTWQGQHESKPSPDTPSNSKAPACPRAPETTGSCTEETCCADKNEKPAV